MPRQASRFKALLVALNLIALPLHANGATHSYANSASSPKQNHEYYIRGNLGFPFYRRIVDSFQDKARFMPHGNIAFGLRYKKFGADIEGGYLYFKTKSTIKPNMLSKSGLNSKTLFLNLFFYPALIENKINAYIGAGVGQAFNNAGNRYLNINNTWYLTYTGLRTQSMSAQGTVGLEYMLSSKFAVLADARYIYLGKFTQKANNISVRSTERVSIATFMIGLKYKF